MEKFPKLNNFNEIYTPPEAVDIIAKYIPKGKIYRESCYWEWHFAKRLRELWFNVVGHKDIDCLQEQPEERDIRITNPPFNWNKKFLERAINLWKPFVILFRLEHLWWVEASRLLKWLPITIIIPKKRINYIHSKKEKTPWSPFHSIFLCYWLELNPWIIYD